MEMNLLSHIYLSEAVCVFLFQVSTLKVAELTRSGKMECMSQLLSQILFLQHDPPIDQVPSAFEIYMLSVCQIILVCNEYFKKGFKKSAVSMQNECI